MDASLKSFYKNFSFLSKVQLFKVAVLRLKDLPIVQTKNVLIELDLDSYFFQKKEKFLFLRLSTLVLKTKQLSTIIKLLAKNWCIIGFFFPFELSSFLTNSNDQNIFFLLQLFLIKKYTPGFLTNWKSQYLKLFSYDKINNSKISHFYLSFFPKFFIILDFQRFHLSLSEINLLNLPSILLGAFSFNPNYTTYQFNVGGSKKFLAFFFLSFFISILSYSLKLRYLFLSSCATLEALANSSVDTKIESAVLKKNCSSSNNLFRLSKNENDKENKIEKLIKERVSESTYIPNIQSKIFRALSERRKLGDEDFKAMYPYLFLKINKYFPKSNRQLAAIQLFDTHYVELQVMADDQLWVIEFLSKLSFENKSERPVFRRNIVPNDFPELKNFLPSSIISYTDVLMHELKVKPITDKVRTKYKGRSVDRFPVGFKFPKYPILPDDPFETSSIISKLNFLDSDFSAFVNDYSTIYNSSFDQLGHSVLRSCVLVQGLGCIYLPDNFNINDFSSLSNLEIFLLKKYGRDLDMYTPKFITFERILVNDEITIFFLKFCFSYRKLYYPLLKNQVNLSEEFNLLLESQLKSFKHRPFIMFRRQKLDENFEDFKEKFNKEYPISPRTEGNELIADLYRFVRYRT